MNIAEMRHLVESAVADGRLVRAEGTMLSSSEGYNHTGRAVLGALLDNVGKPTFNAYCKNQKSMTGWLSSKSNPVCQMARNLLKAVDHDDPTCRSMLTDVEREFIRPLIDEHTRLGGRRPSNAEIDAASAMLATKIMLDLDQGNGDLAKSVPVLAVSDNEADLPETSSAEPEDNYRTLGISEARANVALEIAQHIHDASCRGALYLASSSFIADRKY